MDLTYQNRAKILRHGLVKHRISNSMGDLFCLEKFVVHSYPSSDYVWTAMSSLYVNPAL